MKYFTLIHKSEIEAGDLVVVDRQTQGFDQFRLNQGEKIENWPKEISFTVEGKNQMDIIVGGAEWILYSERFRSVTLEHTSGTNVQFLPVTVINPSCDIGLYWVMNVILSIDALDHEHTFWLDKNRNSESDDPIALNVLAPVLSKEKIRDHDIFCLRIGEIQRSSPTVSGKLKSIYEKADVVNGIIFLPIKTT